MLRKNRFFPGFLLSSFEGEGDVGGGSSDVKTLEQRLAAANNNAMIVAQNLSNENIELNRQLRAKGETITTLTTENGELKKKIPAEGALVLAGDDVTTWQAVKALNMTPDQIKLKLQTTSQAETELAKYKRRDLLRQAADAPAFDGAMRFDADVLESVIGDSEIVFQDVNKDGKTRKVAHVKSKENGTDKLTQLGEFAETNYAKFLPSLKVSGETADSGTRFVKQDASGAPAGSADPVADRLKARSESRKANPNPLMPKAAQA